MPEPLFRGRGRDGVEELIRDLRCSGPRLCRRGQTSSASVSQAMPPPPPRLAWNRCRPCPGASVATLHHACTAAGTDRLPYSTWAVEGAGPRPNPGCAGRGGRPRERGEADPDPDLGSIRVAQEEEDLHPLIHHVQPSLDEVWGDGPSPCSSYSSSTLAFLYCSARFSALPWPPRPPQRRCLSVADWWAQEGRRTGAGLCEQGRIKRGCITCRGGERQE